MNMNKLPNSWKVKFHQILQQLLEMKKPIIIFGLVAIFMIAGFFSALSTISNGIKTSPQKTSPPDSYQVLPKESDPLIENTDSPSLQTNSPTKTTSQTPAHTATPGASNTISFAADISLKVSSETASSGSNGKVKYTLTVNWKNTQAEKNFKGAKVNFYTGPQTAYSYPSQIVGNSNLDSTNTATLQFDQPAGNYSAGAVLIGQDGSTLSAVMVKYTVNKADVVKPTLTFKVDIKKIITTNATTAPIDLKNITYTLIVTVPDAIKNEFNSQKMKVDFYYDAQNNSFPAKLAGSVVLANNQASFSFHQEPGNYSGGAIIADTPWGKINSNIVKYTVPKLLTPITTKSPTP